MQLAKSAIEVLADAGALAGAAAERFIRLAEAAAADRGRFAVALSGGSTPRAMHARLAQPDMAARVPWERVHLFWGDERCVPPDHPESNYRMAYETLLAHVPIPPGNIHRIWGELPPAEAANAYEEELHEFFGARSFYGPDAEDAAPRFDLVLLGLGEDGHTASLFPGSPALGETERWSAAVWVEKLGSWRITLTPVVLNAARQVVFLVSGAGKAETLRRVLAGPADPDALPAQVVAPAGGEVVWLVDSAARSETHPGFLTHPA